MTAPPRTASRRGDAPPRRPSRRRIAIVAAVAVALAGCAGTAPASEDPYTGSALSYGQAPVPDQGATFQRDVLIVGGGGDAVRTVSADGLTWTLEADAPGIDRLEEGGVLFVTGRGVGRILALERVDDGIAVTLGPVEITEVIRDGVFASDGPVGFDRVVVQESSDAFWADPDVATEAGIGTVDPSSFSDIPPVRPSLVTAVDANPARGTLPPARLGTSASTTTGAFHLTSNCCTNGIETGFTYDKGGVRIVGAVALQMSAPTARFNLAISGGTVTSAEFRLDGAAALHAQLEAATASGRSVNGYSPPLGLNIDFAVPVGTLLGVPFSVTVSQMLNVHAFMPGTASVTGVGDYRLKGALGFRYANGSLTSPSSAAFDAATSLSGTNSLAVGISGVAVDYTVKFTLGLGMFGFTAGLHFSITAQATLTVGAPIGFNVAEDAQDPIEKCKSAQAGFWIGYGVGYSIPKPVAELVNWFLEKFGTEPIQAAGGPASRVNLFNSVAVHPDVPICRKS